MERSWGFFGTSWAVLDASWAILAALVASQVRLGSHIGHIGRLGERQGRVWEPTEPREDGAALCILARPNVPGGTVADCGAVMSENGRSGKMKKAGRGVHSFRRFRKQGHMLAAASSGFVGSAADRKLGRAEVKAEAARAGPDYPVLLREALLGMFFSGEIIDASRIPASPSRNDAQAS